MKLEYGQPNLIDGQFVLKRIEDKNLLFGSLERSGLGREYYIFLDTKHYYPKGGAWQENLRYLTVEDAVKASKVYNK